jgi:activator of HSP90 ATPase
MPNSPRRPLHGIRQRVRFPAPPLEVYAALVTARLVAAFTGAPATGRARVGGRFTAWDGYITGLHRELSPGKRIVQDWSTTEWPDGAPASRLEIDLSSAATGTELRMVHKDVPASQAEGYRQGWIDYYWTPLAAFFDRPRATRSRE